ncbi:hypothetical protein QUB00_14570 [Microcoleus sp. F8_C2]
MICKHLKAYFYPYVSSVAIPTSAISPAGASLIPSPTIATIFPGACSV